MKGVLFTFLLPYVFTLLGAAYNIQQALDGLGLHSINFMERDPHGRIVGSTGLYKKQSPPFSACSFWQQSASLAGRYCPATSLQEKKALRMQAR